MARRLIINTKGGSPFKVSMAGVDALGASWENLLFDGDQAPLLLYSSSYLFMNPISEGNIAYVNYSSVSIPLFPRPAGQYPAFLVMWRAPFNPTGGTYQPGQHATPGFKVLPSPGGDSGGGGVMGQAFHGLNYCRHGFEGNYINFLIFRNYYG